VKFRDMSDFEKSVTLFYEELADDYSIIFSCKDLPEVINAKSKCNAQLKGIGFNLDNLVELESGRA
tara:strand:- start:232 stop:429 length:198 start_codon:yes stop_codon:yes gene_type:complete